MKKFLHFKFMSIVLFTFFGVAGLNAQVFFTEFADPDNNLNARYIELYNAGSSEINFTEGSGWKIVKNVNGSLTSLQTLLLTGKIPSKGYYIIAYKLTSDEFNTLYGVLPNQLDPITDGVAGANGDDPFELINGAGTVVDQFGIPGQDGTATSAEYEDGRAERVASVVTSQAVYLNENWTTWSDGPTPGGDFVAIKNAPSDFDSGDWIGQIKTATDLFFSEYTEGSSSNRAVEIFNGTGAPVDLSTYKVKQSYGGQGWGIRDGVAMIEYVLPLSGTLADGDVFVFYNSDATIASILAEGDLALTYADGTDGCRVASYTGDDALGLFKNDVLIDIIGQVDVDPGTGWAVAGISNATVDHTLIRKAGIMEGNTDWTSSAGTNEDNSEWLINAIDYTENIGEHTFGANIDQTAPTFTTVPSNGDINVLVNTIITITFDEAIRNTDDTEITNSNVADLLTLKETDASGTAVAFTATIDEAKKIITATPSAPLKNSQLYYATLASVEDVSNNAITAGSMTFTTIAIDAPFISDVAIAETVPYYAGDEITITWTSSNVTNVKIEAWVPSEASWEELLVSVPSDGNEIFTIPASAYYSTAYKIRVSDVINNTIYDESATFEIIAIPNIYEIQSNTTNGDISEYKDQKVRVSGIVTAVKAGEFWIQEENIAKIADYPAYAGILCYNYTVGPTLTIGDNITLYATVTEYNGITELGTITNHVVNSQGNNISSVVISALDANEAYESTLITLKGAIVKTAADATTKEFTVNDGTADYIVDDKIIAYTPTVGDMLNITGVIGFATPSFKIYPRTTADVVVSSLGVEDLLSTEIKVYPNPGSGHFYLQLGNAFKTDTKVEVFNAVGMCVLSTKASGIITDLDLNTMKQGVYYVRVDDGKTVFTQKIVIQ